MMESWWYNTVGQYGNGDGGGSGEDYVWGGNDSVEGEVVVEKIVVKVVVMVVVVVIVVVVIVMMVVVRGWWW